MKTAIPSRLSDTALIAEVKRLAQSERQTTAALISHLAELDSRRLYLAAGYSSLFTYCTEVLRLSEHEAYNRIEAARASRRFPILLEQIDQGALNLTTVRLLAPHLTADNHEELVAASSGKSKREVEELLARHFPRPDVAPLIRKLPAPKEVPAPVPLATVPPATTPVPAVSPVLPLPARRPVVSPLAPDRYEIRFTASAATRAKLRLAQDLLRHSVPDGDLAEIVGRALTSLLDHLARKKLAAATSRPGPSRTASPASRHIPARVKRAVWLRDGGRCAFAGSAGRRCTERGFLEFHHVQPYAAGGLATVANIQLRCRPHNAYESELYYGPIAPLGGGGVVSESGASLPPPQLVPERVRHEPCTAAQRGFNAVPSAGLVSLGDLLRASRSWSRLWRPTRRESASSHCQTRTTS